MSAVSRVLVVGGGIGGLTASIALRRAGIEVDLVEIKPDWTVYGVGIIQPNNTLRALDKIGLARACVDAGGPYPGWRIHDAHGKVLMHAPASNAAAPAYPPINGITRPLLHKVLIDAARAADANVRLGVTVARMSDKGDCVDVLFTDLSSGSYDFVIGCDGLYSQIREHLFGSAVTPRHVGQSVWRYNLPRPGEMEWGEIHFGATTKVGLVPLSPTLMYMFLVTHEPGNPRMPAQQLASLMRQRLADYGGFIGELREQIVDSAAVVYKPLENLLLPAPWMKGRVIVIGDAAHATTPHLAQGAAMAIEDAVLLGELLRQDEPLAVLLDEFMRRRFKRAKYVVDASEQLATWELEEWAGIHNPEARPGELLHQATLTLLEDY